MRARLPAGTEVERRSKPGGGYGAGRGAAMDAAVQVTKKLGAVATQEAHVKDAPLQADVKLLAELLEEILREQEGPELAQLLEDVIAHATRARSGSSEDAEALRKLLGTLESGKA